jgi:uncharacterized membrane protein YedE/YeeE
LVAALALANYIGGSDGETAALWLLGIGAGFTLQRARFCFASAFRDIFLFGSGRMMNGILVGLAVATVGSSLVMFRLVPRAAFGILPPEAHVLPVGITTIIGGVLFGVGMVLAGGCVSGSLYRMAEGYVASWVSVGGIVIGLGILAHSWNWWYDTVISAEPEIWLPSILNLGYGGGVALTLLGLLGVYLLVTWWQSRSGLIGPMLPSRSPSPGAFGQEISAIWRTVFVQGWSPVAGGAVLGGIAVLMYLVHMPWGVTGELARWSNGIMGILGVAAPVAKGAAEIGGCAVRMQTSGVFTHTFGVTVGLLPGAFVAALLAREFKLRFPKERKRYVQSLVGGVLMGYGSGLAIGCTIGAFFSSVASLSVSGWLFGLALAGGAYLGVQVIKRMG